MDEKRYQQISQKFDEYYQAQQQQAQQAEQERLNPSVRIHYSSRSSMVDVPFRQAVITGMFGGAVLLSVTWAIASQIGDPSPVKTALTWAGVGAPFLTFCAWLIFTADIRKLIWSLERISGRDIDQDGQTGEPEEQEPAQTWIFHSYDPERRSATREKVDDPDSQEALIRFAGAVLEGAEFTEDAWKKKGSVQNYGLTIRQLREVKTLCHNLHYLRQASGSGDLKVTKMGWYSLADVLARSQGVDIEDILEKFPPPPDP